MTTKNYLTIDFGASNGRATVAKFNGKKFNMDTIYNFNNRPVCSAGTLYWDILRLYSELKIGIQSSVKRYKNIASIALDTWGIDFGLIDSSGKLISNPVHYRDKGKDNNAMVEFFRIISKEELFKLTGWNPISIAPLFYLYSLRLKKAPELDSAKKFLMIPDIFNYFLTGCICNEFTIASNSQMLNWRSKRWEDKILKEIGISKGLFSEVVMPGNKIGNIASDVCEELEIENIPVIAPATHDTASAVAGIPVAGKDKDWAFLSMGTWFVLGLETEEPVINYDILEYGFTNEGAVEGKSFLARNLTGLWIIQQCREKWIRDKGRNISWDEIVKLSSRAESLNSFINIDDPIFSQVQVDMQEVIINYCRKNNFAIPETIGETARCIYESLSLALKYHINIIGKLTNRKIELLHLIGGGTQNKILCQWISNATELRVVSGPVEATSVGNLIMQLKAAGEIKNLEEGRKISLNSSEMIYYEPEEKEKWADAYSRYLELL